MKITAKGRALANMLFGGIAAILAILSLWAGMDSSSTLFMPSHKQLGAILIVFWVGAPPLFFWFDWVVLCKNMRLDSAARDVAKHTHDLSRNIWLALVLILVYLFFERFPFDH